MNLGANTAAPALRLVDVLKACRSEWLTARETADAVGYSKACHARRLLAALAAQGLVDERSRIYTGTSGPKSKEYRVNPRWRND